MQKQNLYDFTWKSTVFKFPGIRLSSFRPSYLGGNVLGGSDTPFPIVQKHFFLSNSTLIWTKCLHLQSTPSLRGGTLGLSFFFQLPGMVRCRTLHWIHSLPHEVDDFIKLVMQHSRKTVSGPYLLLQSRDQSENVIICLLLSRVIFGLSYSFIPYYPLRKYVCKMNSM